MNSLLPFIIAGLVSGSIYGLAGVGLVLTYKTSGIFNFAHGALATVAAYLFYTLHVQDHWSWPLSAAVCVVGLGVGMGLLFERLAERLAQAPTAQQIAATIGAMILVTAGFTLVYGSNQLTMSPFLPHSSFKIAGVVLTVDQVIIVVIGVVVTATLYVFLQQSRRGISMRAVVDDPNLLSLSEFSPQTIRRQAWIIGCTLATLSGVLIAPTLSLTPNQLTLLIVAAFGAAALGQFVSLPRTYLGGLVLGVIASVLTDYVGNSQSLAGLPTSVPFLVLFLLLVALPPRMWRLTSLRRVPLTLSTLPRSSWRVQMITAIPLVVLAAIVPELAGFHLDVWTEGLAFVILFGSLALLVRVAGQVSLCHVAFMAIGASTFARLAGDDHINWALAAVAASLVVVPIGALLALPASRLPVLFLGLATLGFGLAVQELFYSTNLMFSPFAEGLFVGRPHLGSFSLASDRRYYYLVLIIAVLSMAVILTLFRSRFGRTLVGISNSPIALKALGTDERVTRVLVFAISAFFAGLAGALYAGAVGAIDATSFDPIQSLTYMVLVIIAVGDPLWASIGGAVGIAIIPGYVQSGNISQYLQMAFGIIAIAVAVAPRAKLPSQLSSIFARRRPVRTVHRATLIQAELPPKAGADLEVREISVSYGGVRAVDSISLQARAGTVTGLIGPNGAGKTSLFNACSGLVKPASGHIVLDGRDITGLGTARRAQLGLGRTFQQTELFSSMTVLENLRLGYEAPMAGASPWAHVVASAKQRRQAEAMIAAAVELCSLEPLLAVAAGALSTGQRRTVEVARCITGPVKTILLDEPSAGLDSGESEQLAGVLRRLKEERGLGILMVEHDMDLVMTVCDYIYVLDFGQLIFQGNPSEVQASEVVQLAYLGRAAGAEEAGSPAGRG